MEENFFTNLKIIFINLFLKSYFFHLFFHFYFHLYLLLFFFYKVISNIIYNINIEVIHLNIINNKCFAQALNTCETAIQWGVCVSGSCMLLVVLRVFLSVFFLYELVDFSYCFQWRKPNGLQRRITKYLISDKNLRSRSYRQTTLAVVLSSAVLSTDRFVMACWP